MFANTIEYCKSMPANTAMLVIPGSPAIALKPAVIDADGVITTAEVPAVEEVKDQTYDITASVDALYFLSAEKDTKWLAKQAYPAMIALGFSDTEKVYLAYHYASKTHSGFGVGTLASALDKGICANEVQTDPAILAALKVIETRTKEICDSHKKADGFLWSTGKATASASAPVKNGAMAFLAQLEATAGK